MFEFIIPARAAERPNQIAVYVGNVAYTYLSLEQDIRAWTGWIAQRGFAPRTRILVNVNDPYLFFVLLLALERNGLTGVLQASASLTTPERLAFLGVEGALSDAKSEGNPNVRWVQIGKSWRKPLSDYADAQAAPIERHPEDPVWIILSSGTTGESKKVLLTRRLIDYRTLATADTMLLGHGNRSLSLIPFFTVGGVAIFLHAILQGGSVAYRLPEESWQSTLDRDNFNAILAAPAHLALMLSGLPADYRPGKEMAISIGGGVLPRALAAATAQRLTREIYVSYGSTETGVVTQGRFDTFEAGSEAAGTLIDTVDGRVVDGEGKCLPAGADGQIELKGPQVACGYVDGAEETRRHFNDGWYCTGDWGSIDADRTLIVRGRRDDLLNLGGGKVQASRLESTVLERFPDLDLVALAATAPGKMVPQAWIVIEDPGRVVDCKAVHGDCKLPPKIAIARTDRIPRNAMGKFEVGYLRGEIESGVLIASN